MILTRAAVAHFAWLRVADRPPLSGNSGDSRAGRRSQGVPVRDGQGTVVASWRGSCPTSVF